MARILAGILAALTTLIVIGFPSPAASNPVDKNAYPYVLVDPGTFGGPSNLFNGPASTLVSDKGVMLGTADTGISDADYPNNNPLEGQDPYIQHGFEWSKGRLTELGALPGNNSSGYDNVNANGLAAGASENGKLDPLTGYPAFVAVAWKNGKVRKIGTLPGGYESYAYGVDDRGRITGFSSNGKVDMHPLESVVFGINLQRETRTFLWYHGKIRDIGTLGGPDSMPWAMNRAGQIAGMSYTGSTPNSSTGLPTIHPFLWTNGHMRDLHGLGGSFSTIGWLNNRGQVGGTSYLPGDRVVHPFLWDGKRMIDLGTLGGGAVNSDIEESVSGVNVKGHVAGWSELPGDKAWNAFLWMKGAMRDLPPVNGAPCSFSIGLNNKDAVVGATTDCHSHLQTGVLWEHGHAYDLNSLVQAPGVKLLAGNYINDRGEIAAEGTLQNGQSRVYLLIPAKLAARDGIEQRLPTADLPAASGTRRISLDKIAGCWGTQGPHPAVRWSHSSSTAALLISSRAQLRP